MAKKKSEIATYADDGTNEADETETEVTDTTEYEKIDWQDWEFDESSQEVVHEGTALDRAHLYHMELGIYEANSHVFKDSDGYLCVRVPKAVPYNEDDSYVTPSLIIDGEEEGTENGDPIPTLPTGDNNEEGGEDDDG